MDSYKTIGSDAAASSSQRSSGSISTIVTPALASVVITFSQHASTPFSRPSHKTALGTPILISDAPKSASGLVSSAITPSRSAISSTPVPIGPIVSLVDESGTTPPAGYLSVEGRNPIMPHKAAGIRTDPPVSDPNPAMNIPAAIAAAVPPEEPPAILVLSQGFLTAPWQELLEVMP